jgi:potassium efflux system protein
MNQKSTVSLVILTSLARVVGCRWFHRRPTHVALAVLSLALGAEKSLAQLQPPTAPSQSARSFQARGSSDFPQQIDRSVANNASGNPPVQSNFNQPQSPDNLNPSFVRTASQPSQQQNIPPQGNALLLTPNPTLIAPGTNPPNSSAPYPGSPYPGSSNAGPPYPGSQIQTRQNPVGPYATAPIGGMQNPNQQPGNASQFSDSTHGNQRQTNLVPQADRNIPSNGGYISLQQTENGGVPQAEISSPANGPWNDSLGNPLPSQPEPNTPPSSPANSEVSGDTVQARQQQLESDTGLAASEKAELAIAYETILAELKTQADNQRLANEFTALADSAPEALQNAKQSRAFPDFLRTLSANERQTASLDTLQSELQRLQAELQSTESKRIAEQQKLASRESRRKELVKQIADERTLLDSLSTQTASAGTSAATPRLKEASRWKALAKRDSAKKRLAKLIAELRAYEAEAELLPIEVELLGKKETQLRDASKVLTTVIAARRERIISAYEAEVFQTAATLPPSLKPYSDHLLKRIEQWRELTRNSSAIRKTSETAKNLHKLWGDRFSNMASRDSKSASVGGFNSLVGLMLRRHKAELPNTRVFQSRLAEYSESMVESEALIIELDDINAQVNGLNDNQTTASKFLSSIIDGPPINLAPSDQAGFQQLLKIQSGILADFRQDASTYFNDLFSVATTEEETLTVVNDYRDFIDQHVLWIRSSDRISRSQLQHVLPALQWLISRDNWMAAGKAVGSDSLKHPFWTSGLVLSWLLLIFNTSKIRRRILRIANSSTKINETSFRKTAQGVLLCIVVALAWPLLIFGLGIRLMNASPPQTFGYAISFACIIVARYFVALEAIRQITRENGIAERLLGWHPDVTKLLRTNLRWLIDLGLPFVGLCAIYSAYIEETWENSVGRFSFLVLMTLSSVFLCSTFKPRGGVFKHYLLARQGGWADRLRYVWFFLISGAPIGLIGLSLLGYHFTAQRIAFLTYASLVAMTAIMLVYHALHRWSVLSRRRLQMEQAREQRQLAEREADSDLAKRAVPPETVDVEELNAQTLRLIGSGAFLVTLGALLFIWQDILPAVSALQGVTVWGKNTETPLTLAALLAAIPIMAITFIAARNLPGLLEIVLLQYLPIEASVRYAISTLSQYLIFAIGLTVSLAVIGIEWSSIQWLIAALGVGLGFGLQEIFANFVSGIILLFEQPIRVGDVITLGDVTGSVSRIRMRATTILNWDRQELIIPNKDLITGRLLNWTLSDSTNRMVLTVGIAYGAKTEKACALLKEICGRHSNVLTDPEPTAYFENFGDSTLDITIRFFLARLDQRLETRHQLLTAIDNEFRSAGLEIAFPQRDLHIRTMPPMPHHVFDQLQHNEQQVA